MPQNLYNHRGIIEFIKVCKVVVRTGLYKREISLSGLARLPGSYKQALTLKFVIKSPTLLGYPRTQVVVCLIMCVLFVVINQHYSEITIGLVRLTTFRLPSHEKTQTDLSFRSVWVLALFANLPPPHMKIFRPVWVQLTYSAHAHSTNNFWKQTWRQSILACWWSRYWNLSYVF